VNPPPISLLDHEQTFARSRFNELKSSVQEEKKKKKEKKNHEISTFALPLLLFPKKKKNAIRTNSPASQ